MKVAFVFAASESKHEGLEDPVMVGVCVCQCMCAHYWGFFFLVRSHTCSEGDSRGPHVSRAHDRDARRRSPDLPEQFNMH